MAKLKKTDFRPARERIAALPPERREKIETGAAAILEAMHLSEIRKALNVTQTALAERAGIKQGEISRIEKNPETVQLQTLERYAKGLGGEVTIVVTFPDGTRAELPVSHGHPVKSRLTVRGGHVSAKEDGRAKTRQQP